MRCWREGRRPTTEEDRKMNLEVGRKDESRSREEEMNLTMLMGGNLGF
jgi:hypothetical protein